MRRRRSGEPLAWITGWASFCGERITVHPGVYVPRWQSEPLAREARRRLPAGGFAVDLCTGAGPIAVALGCRDARARIIGTDLDMGALRCARSNGVVAVASDLASALGEAVTGTVDVVTGVVPYVPTEALRLLPRDVLAFEPRQALDGGRGGMEVLERAVSEAARLLRRGGSLLLELGGTQADALAPALAAHGFRGVFVDADEDGEVRALWCERR